MVGYWNRKKVRYTSVGGCGSGGGAGRRFYVG